MGPTRKAERRLIAMYVVAHEHQLIMSLNVISSGRFGACRACDPQGVLCFTWTLQIQFLWIANSKKGERRSRKCSCLHCWWRVLSGVCLFTSWGRDILCHTANSIFCASLASKRKTYSEIRGEFSDHTPLHGTWGNLERFSAMKHLASGVVLNQ